MNCELFELDTLENYDIVIILSIYNGLYLLSRHKKSVSWEFQGGPLQEGETPVMAAKRELSTESGACGYSMEPFYDFSFENDKGQMLNGKAFIAQVYELGPLGECEMRERKTFESLPEHLMYPEITNLLISKKEERDEY